ncbi:MAG: hypothetical protein HWD59_09705 [Coxiellaceae bacterium]|nr:MAG: hypothetical protein HWD59_09705 [Coxiellaceae bacterium]
MVAPAYGIIYDTYYRVGEFVPAGKPVASLLAPMNVYLVFTCQKTIESYSLWSDNSTQLRQL